MKTNRTESKSISMWVTVIVSFVVPCLPGFAGLQQPPLSMFGRLETPTGEALTTGDLVITLTQANQKSSVSKKAILGAFQNGLTFTVGFDVEQVPVANPNQVLKYQTLYFPSATFNGEPVDVSSFPETVTPLVGTVIGPVTLSATPDGPVLALSGPVVFGAQKVNTAFVRRLTVRNVGSEPLIGIARLKTGSYFRIVEEGVAISFVEIEVPPQGTQSVNVRFLPTILSGGLFDEVIFESNGGADRRNVTGQSVVTLPLNYDLAPDIRDGKVNPLDFFRLLELKEANPSSFSPEVLFAFAREWSP